VATHAVVWDTAVGWTLGDYQRAEKILAGGMAEVYRACDEHLSDEVASEVFPPGTLTNKSARKYLQKEVVILSQFRPPQCRTTHDADTQQRVDFLLMEYIPGITLSENVAAGPMSEKDGLRLGVELAEGLSAAHEHRVNHRDLKLGDLRVTSDGRLETLDVGLVKLWRPVMNSPATRVVARRTRWAGLCPTWLPE
jgi:serine/threonine-protein kinase